MALLPGVAGRVDRDQLAVAEVADPAGAVAVAGWGDLVLEAWVRQMCFFGKNRPAGEYSGYT